MCVHMHSWDFVSWPGLKSCFVNGLMKMALPLALLIPFVHVPMLTPACTVVLCIRLEEWSNYHFIFFPGWFSEVGSLWIVVWLHKHLCLHKCEVGISRQMAELLLSAALWADYVCAVGEATLKKLLSITCKILGQWIICSCQMFRGSVTCSSQKICVQSYQ